MSGTSQNRLTYLGGGVEGDVLGMPGGAESHVLTEAQLASHDHSFTGTQTYQETGTVSADHTHGFSGTTADGGGSVDARLFALETVTGTPAASSSGAAQTTTGVTHAHTFSGQTGGISTNHFHGVYVTAAGTVGNAGSGSGHPNVQPTIVENVIIKF